MTDAAGLLGPGERETIAQHHALLLRHHDIDYRVDVAPDAGDLLRHGVRRFAELGVGSRSRHGRGLLLVIDPVQDRVRLEVGQSLEGVFPDAFVAYLEERQMVPFFRESRVADGILAATELVVTRAQQAEAHAAFEPPTSTARAASAGGGAAAGARLGAGRDERFRQGPDAGPGAGPQATVDAYLAAMRTRNARTDLALYTRETRKILAAWVKTPAQMDALANAYRGCTPEPPRIDESGTRAVLRYPPDARQCAPWLLLREDGAWRLDLATAQHLIRFNTSNAWHFTRPADHPYTFAFTDWHLDPHGFPRGR